MSKEVIIPFAEGCQIRKPCATTWFVEREIGGKRMGTINYPGNEPKGENRYHAILSGGNGTDLGHFQNVTEAAHAVVKAWFERSKKIHDVLDTVDPSWGD